MLLPPKQRMSSTRGLYCHVSATSPTHDNPTTYRIKLYNRAHELSAKAKDSRLKREYRKMREIKLLIFLWMWGGRGLATALGWPATEKSLR